MCFCRQSLGGGNSGGKSTILGVGTNDRGAFAMGGGHSYALMTQSRGENEHSIHEIGGCCWCKYPEMRDEGILFSVLSALPCAFPLVKGPPWRRIPLSTARKRPPASIARPGSTWYPTRIQIERWHLEMNWWDMHRMDECRPNLDIELPAAKPHTFFFKLDSWFR